MWIRRTDEITVPRRWGKWVQNLSIDTTRLIAALRWEAESPVDVAETCRINATRHHPIVFLHGYTNQVSTKFDPGEVRTIATRTRPSINVAH